MDRYLISGGNPLKGKITISGAKNVALKAIVAGLLTDEEVIINNVPIIADLLVMRDIISDLGVKVEINDNHQLKIKADNITNTKVSLESGARLRTSSMVIGPLLARCGKATIPNPGGCRIGARPIDRHIKGIKQMGAEIEYIEGYFQAKVKKLTGTKYLFDKNSHTGTETLILTAVLAEGETILENAAVEPEVDDLINLLNQMGAKIKRTHDRQIVIEGVKKLHGTTYKIMTDRNEIVTYAIGALVTNGDITIEGAEEKYLKAFLQQLDLAKAKYQILDNGIRFFSNGELMATDVVTKPHPGFMTDWQAPWAILAIKSNGISIIHETIFENRFGYVPELIKMGAKIEYFNPNIPDPKSFYNFNYDGVLSNQAVKIVGPSNLHNAVLKVSDLRAGATLVLAALSAKGESAISGVEQIDRGYENFENQLKKLGANIKREIE